MNQFHRTSSLSLTLQKGSVQQGETISLYPAGGTHPYSFGLVAGNLFYSSGTLGSITNQAYTAGTVIGSVTIHLTDADGSSVDSQVTIIPPAPTSFTVQNNAGAPNNDLLLSWSYADTSLISGFEIQRSPDGVTFTDLVGLTAATLFYVDSPLNPGQTYYYRMYAVAGPYQSLLTGVMGASPS